MDRRQLDANVPLLASVVTSAVALVNLVAVVRPAWQPLGFIRRIDPALSLAHLRAAVIPAGVALLVVSAYLRRRSARALAAVVTLLVFVGITKLVDGRDVDGAALALVLAAALLSVRRDFPVRGAALTSCHEASTVVGISAACIGITVISAWLIAPDRPSLGSFVVGSAMGSGSDGVSFALAVGGSVLAVTIAETLLRARSPLGSAHRGTAQRILRAHGRDTLAAFKLRADVDYFMNPDETAFAAYRVEGGTLLLAGDPVGERSAVPLLVDDIASFARRHGLQVGVVGADRTMLPVYRSLGMHALYIGDEAIVDTMRFSLEGRSIRKVRQSVARLHRAGFHADVVTAEDVDPELCRELERVSDAWRDGRSERGFSMAIDDLAGASVDGSLLVVARDGSGRLRGFLQFLPTYGRPAMSLSAMRREPDTPNGLVEFLVVSAIDAFNRRGVAEMSLNFAVFGSLFRSRESRLARILVRLLRVPGRFFQIESLYRFSAKFQPRWEPRYLIFDRALALPRIGLATLWAEGQLPRLRRS
jgi:lysyl-tRNA synthetase class 2